MPTKTPTARASRRSCLRMTVPRGQSMTPAYVLIERFSWEPIKKCILRQPLTSQARRYQMLTLP